MVNTGSTFQRNTAKPKLCMVSMITVYKPYTWDIILLANNQKRSIFPDSEDWKVGKQ